MEKTGDNLPILTHEDMKVGKKRHFNTTGLPINDPRATKLVSTQLGPQGWNDDHSLALMLINGFNSFENDIQHTILDTLTQKLK